MTHEEAMKAATRGFKVAPVGKAGFFVYYTAEAGFRRITIGNVGTGTMNIFLHRMNLCERGIYTIKAR
ncbi:hypothetical protein RB43ORF284c [Escherichia phage RB43]|uniref:Uncharacterized protein n=1 Tax=Escherichia phage RB43 TaxID=2887182 RepID=Q56BB5_9CAUD|nr:hypothetical protein RB43ORF284c [Escherichia phage RB43]AAX78806.1 hypothetical protein RB43ORF284c [Escherichia phage RB43]